MLRGLSPQVRLLMGQLHRVPHCATFGAAYPGAIRYVRYSGEAKPRLDECQIELEGRMIIVVNPHKPHIEDLLELIRASVTRVTGASFQRDQFILGPAPDSPLQAWMIELGDDGALEFFGDQRYGMIKPTEYPEAFQKARDRYRLMKQSWSRLGREVEAFANDRSFPRRPNYAARTNELVTRWNE
ncbi:MAG: hypothetical protein WCG99_04845 [Candidatus Berkelbacteria bacterium]